MKPTNTTPLLTLPQVLQSGKPWRHITSLEWREPLKSEEYDDYVGVLDLYEQVYEVLSE